MIAVLKGGEMKKTTPILLTFTVLLLLVQACLPVAPAPTQDLSFLGTAIMETMVAGATQTSQAFSPTVMLETPTPLPTSTPELPSDTPTITLTPSPVFTATSVVPQISVSVATNCRVGPGRVYDRVGGLLVGQVAEVVGRNASSNYWYIRNPSRSGGFCWLWGEYATVTGNVSALPVVTPPPTPTPVPGFVASYDGLDSCVGWWVDIELRNTGSLTFRSVSLTVRDTVTDVVVSTVSDNFTNLNGCADSITRDVLEPGASPDISSPPFAYNPAGHELRATITLCSSEGLNGTCVTQSITFKP